MNSYHVLEAIFSMESGSDLPCKNSEESERAENPCKINRSIYFSHLVSETESSSFYAIKNICARGTSSLLPFFG